MKPSFYDPRKDGISQSILAGWLRCRQYSKLHLSGYERKGSLSKALEFGIFVHEILSILYSRGKVPSPGRVKRTVNRLSKKWKVKDLEMVEIAKVVLVQYFRFWKNDFKGRWVSTEQEFENKFLGIDKLLRGKRDALYRLHNRLWLFENKTKSQVNEDQILAVLNIDLQVLFYIYNTWLERGECPIGVLYNIIRRPGLRRKKMESIQAFCARIKVHIIKNPGHYFKRYETPIGNDEIKKFGLELRSLVIEFLKWWDGKRPTFKSTENCVTKYGLCKFIPICSNQDYSSFQKRKSVHNELVGVK